MDKDFPDSDVLIYNTTWNNFYSEFLPGEQYEVNFDSTMMDKPHTDPLDSQLGDSAVGFNPMIHNHVTSDNIFDCGNLTDYDINNCMDQVELWTKRAKMAYKEKKSALDYSILNQDFLQQEIKHRDEAIQRLQKDIEQEKVRGSLQVHRLKHELYAMGKLVNDYREQLKDVNRKFEDYKARVQHHLAHSGNAAGSGRGLILSVKGHDQSHAFDPLNRSLIENLKKDGVADLKNT